MFLITQISKFNKTQLTHKIKLWAATDLKGQIVWKTKQFCFCDTRSGGFNSKCFLLESNTKHEKQRNLFFVTWSRMFWDWNQIVKEIQRTRMLFGHGWVDETRPHNLLADWSQEEEKSNMFTEKWMKKTADNRNIYVQTATMSHFCTVADPLWRYMRTQGCREVVHEYADVCQLLCIACILYSTEPRCFCVQTDFQRLRQNNEELHKAALVVPDLTLTHVHANTCVTHSYKHTRTHTQRNTFPLFITPEKKLNKT